MGDADMPCDLVCPVDADGDGYTTASGDCNDSDPSVHPGQLEPCTCDGIDQDCNGVIDDTPCDQAPCKVLGEGEACGGDLGVCGEGLSCCYPCGIPGCQNVCTKTCTDSWCANGCPLYP
jgi:hypothetical protein